MKAEPTSRIPTRSPDRNVDAPFFIIGSPRSGTTLLRLMLDGHPRLAVPHESHFIVGLRKRIVRSPSEPTTEDVLAHHWFPRWKLDADLVRARAAMDQPKTYAELIDSVFTAYAEAKGKVRWGDKTPGYVHYTHFLKELFSHARFIHVIRDGREVAASLAQQEWGSRNAISGAFWWRHKVRAGLRAARRLPKSDYMEVRLEELIARPGEILKQVCKFLGEEYDAAMLDYPRRLPFDPSHAGPDVRQLARPPTPDLRDWRAGLSDLEQAAVGSVCAPLLRQLGYSSARRSVAALAYARAVRTTTLARDAPSLIRAWMNPRGRDF